MRKTFIFMLMGVFLLTFISAQSELGSVKQGSCIDLYNYCDDCTYVNLSGIYYPDNTFEPLNLEMTKEGINYNYTFCNTTQTGLYGYITCGDKGSSFKCERIDFESTYSGKPIDNPRTYAYMFLIIVMGSFAALLLYMVNKLPSENMKDNENRVIQVTWLKYLRFPFWGLAYFSITGVVYLSGALGLAYLGSGIGEMLIYIAILMMWGSLLMMGIFFLKAIDDVIADTKLRKDLTLGVETDRY